MVFCRTKRTCDKVAADMVDRGFAAAAVHGDLGQGAREQALRAFRSGKIDVLVATDVAARGIDVQDVTHVINYQCPDEERTFLHRIGRTGRAGAKGVAVTFVDWDDMPKWGLINKALDLPHPEPVETYSSSKHLYTDLDIPEGTTGKLPRAARTRAGLGAEEIEDVGETGRKPRRPEVGGRGGRDGGRSAGRDSRPGGRDSSRDSSRDSGRGSRDDGPAGDDAPVLPKRTGGSRRRTRGGGDAPGAGVAATTDGASSAAGTTSEGGADAAGRRRRRGGRGRGGGQGGADSGAAASD
jgi:superfamily II DNA/RNA helicase